MSDLDRQRERLAARYHDFTTGGKLGASYRNEWAQHFAETLASRYYYSGDFAGEQQRATGDGKEPPLKYPLGVNIAKWLCMATSRILMGMLDPTEDFTIDFKPAKDTDTARKQAERAGEAWEDIVEETPLLPHLLRGGPESGVDGGFYIQVKKVPLLPPRLIYRSDSEVLPVWNPDNPDVFRECSLERVISGDDARDLAQRYGVLPSKWQLIGRGSELVTYVETWTETEQVILVDDQEIHREPNTLKGEDGRGIIPFVYFPRDRSQHEFYGDALVPDVVGLLKELNIRLKDVGDAVEYNAHPIITVANATNVPKQVPPPGEIINLGRNTSVNNPGANPEMVVLDSQGVHESAFQFISLIVRMLFFMASITSVDVGEDEGSQRSGMTLEVRKLPALQQAKRTQAHWTRSMQRLVRISLMVYKASARNGSDVVVPRMRHIHPKWPELLPTDIKDIIHTIVQLLSPSDYPRISDKLIADLLPFVDNAEEFVADLEKIREERKKEQEAQMDKQMKMKAEAGPSAKPKPTQKEQQDKASSAKKEAA